MNERVTVELDAKAIAAAREAGIDLSELLSRALRRILPQLDASERQQAARQWYEENKEAVDAYNKMLETHGLFSDGVRTF
ncbi:MAG TPA: type II toxin-antitoxin system CcdA family antitoxin [Xanthobacteraceae bacterium]|nr:type II toxin-antitoxin system CcdA family antitoxin [Xanthobacteraceae bacterium]